MEIFRFFAFLSAGGMLFVIVAGNLMAVFTPDILAAYGQIMDNLFFGSSISVIVFAFISIVLSKLR